MVWEHPTMRIQRHQQSENMKVFVTDQLTRVGARDAIASKKLKKKWSLHVTFFYANYQPKQHIFVIFLNAIWEDIMWQCNLLWGSYWVKCGCKSDTALELVQLNFYIKMSPCKLCSCLWREVTQISVVIYKTDVQPLPVNEWYLSNTHGE